MTETIVILAAYMVFIVLISALSGRLSRRVSNKTALGFLLAGQSMPWWLVAFMVCGIAVGGASTVGVAQNAYTSGMSAAWYTGAWAFGGLVFGLCIAKKIRSLSITTISEFFRRAFGRKAALIATVAQVVVLFGVNAAQIVAGGAIIVAVIPTFSMTTALVVSALIFFGTSFLGGYFGASIANIINVVVIYVGLALALVLGVTSFGGFENVTAALPAEGQWFDLIAGMGPAAIVAWFITMAFCTPANQMMFQASASAKDDRNAKWGLVAGSMLMIPTGFISAYIGIMGASAFPDVPSAAALPTVIVSLGPVLAGICLAGLWAADVSTAVSLLIGISTIITKDIVIEYVKPDLSDRGQLILSKVVIAATVACGLLLAMNLSGIVSFLMTLHCLFAPFTVMVLLCLFAPGLLRKSSCMATLGAGCAAMVLYAFVPALHVISQPAYLVVPASFVALLLTLVFDKRAADVSTALSAPAPRDPR